MTATKPRGFNRGYRRWLRRWLAFWWPAVTITGITGLLWRVGWARLPQGPDAPMAHLAEPGCAYVLVDPEVQSLYLKTDIIARPSWLGFGRSLGAAADERVSVAEQKLPPPVFLRETPMTLPPPADLRVSLHLPGLAERPVTNIMVASLVTPPGMWLTLSPALQEAAFTAALSRVQLPAQAGRAHIWIELDADGRVCHALGEGGEKTPAPMAALRALRLGHGVKAAQGWVDISWSATNAVPASEPQ